MYVRRVYYERIEAKEFPVPNPSPFHVVERFTSYSEESALFLKQIATLSNPKPFKNLTHYYPWPGNQVKVIMESLLLLQEISV